MVKPAGIVKPPLDGDNWSVSLEKVRLPVVSRFSGQQSFLLRSSLPGNVETHVERWIQTDTEHAKKVWKFSFIRNRIILDS